MYRIGFAGDQAGEEKRKKVIYTANTGYRAANAGPVVCTQEGNLIWTINGPDRGSHVSRIELLESDDNGNSWSSPRLILSGNKERSVGSFSMIRLSSGKLLHILSRFGGYDHDNFENCILDGFVHSSTDNGRTWSTPEMIPTNEQYLSSVLSSVQLTNGRVVFPFGLLTPNNGQFAVSTVWSDDEGMTWQRSPSVLEAGGGGFESGACEPSVVELPDGRLWMLIRAQCGFQYESFSSDNGETWSVARPSKIPSSNAPAVLLRLKSGRIIVVWNNCTRWAYARYSLMMAATDDGENFFGFREIDNSDDKHVTTSTYWCVTYPYLCEGPEGDIFVSYNYGDWGYNEARIARISPDWIEEKNTLEDFSDGRSAWYAYQSNSGFGELIAPEDNKPGSILRLANNSKDKNRGIARNITNVFSGEIKITVSFYRPGGYILLHNSFLNPGAIDEAVLRIRSGKAGRIYIGAGKAETLKKNTSGGRTLYEYLAYPVINELHYPDRITPGKPVTLTIIHDAAKGNSEVAIDEGPSIPIISEKTMGICYIGLAASAGGDIRVRRIVTSSR